MKKLRNLLERITGFHYVHHIGYAYGYKIPFTNYGIFNNFYSKFKKSPIQKMGTAYHNCTLTNIY